MWERASRECHGKSDARNHLNYNPIDVVNYKVISTLTLTCRIYLLSIIHRLLSILTSMTTPIVRTVANAETMP